ncbi:chemotaxis response regulator protein-glutamate methylesterase [Alkalihalobacillus sp. AL-G]|uniref:protein-glutamate methylesterase/protein-glutamine glutaminase n=1 Tax=Alkalihalobacillus sp. AL-G TaxID=2926399 RepID=UPI00272A5AA2|nr:chemotaxis response regulator protein-glutamate methylesterase [Alkalihalobacillus sp. AL-G]WLD95173.1 chemotaxis response regulator protein-glutamate methylesterase [Alkalihalobacillus sp. AL-G]
MKFINVLVVDDSALMRRVITDLLSSDPEIKVCGTARNGEDALKKIPELSPDVITLDVEMPLKNGLETLKEIMEKDPLPVIMLSNVTRAGTSQTIEAMQQGAIDFISKPSGQISLDLHTVQSELIEKVKLASQVRIRDVISQKEDRDVPTSTIKVNRPKANKKRIISIGTSTGGPRALVEVFSKLPDSLDAPVLVVQHMPSGFTRSLAERLNRTSALEVKEAEEGDILERGKAYIAPGGFHLIITEVGEDLMIKLDEQIPPTRGHRPSVDQMFSSLAGLKNYQKIAVIMTGMGSDGKDGLLALKSDPDTVAIAESKESSVVFGMPRAAIETKEVDEIHHVKDIAKCILSYTN